MNSVNSQNLTRGAFVGNSQTWLDSLFLDIYKLFRHEQKKKEKETCLYGIFEGILWLYKFIDMIWWLIPLVSQNVTFLWKNSKFQQLETVLKTRFDILIFQTPCHLQTFHRSITGCLPKSHAMGKRFTRWRIIYNQISCLYFPLFVIFTGESQWIQQFTIFLNLLKIYNESAHLSPPIVFNFSKKISNLDCDSNGHKNQDS